MTWLKEELGLTDAEAATLIERLNACNECIYYNRVVCTLFPRGAEQRINQYRHLLSGPCPWRASVAPNREPLDIYAQCQNCDHVRPQNRCAMFSAGCDAEQRRRVALARGCRYFRPQPRREKHAANKTLPAWQFVTTAELVADALRLAAELPASDFDGIVGVARSGLIPAAVIATHYHLPLWVVSPMTGRVNAIGSGYRLGDSGRPPDGRLLIVDDTACGGNTMRKVLDVLAKILPAHNLYTAAAYATSDAATELDAVACVYPKPHFLEWNFANSHFAKDTAFDMDGIICVDPHCYDTDPAYKNHLAHAAPLYLPRKWPAIIVTARCERYRGETLDWLERHRVTCRELVMWPGDPEARWATPEAVAQWKADVLKRLRRTGNIHFYAESDPRQAAIIAESAKMPVICPAAGRVFNINTDGTDGQWSHSGT